MSLILDADYMSLLERAGSPQRDRLLSRLDPIPLEQKATSIISFEEQTRGWLAYLAQARSLAQQIQAYQRLGKQLSDYCRLQVLDFDERAAVEFQRLRQARTRLGTMDMKIASIVLAHHATLLSRNMSDFRKIPGLQVEDWTN